MKITALSLLALGILPACQTLPLAQNKHLPIIQVRSPEKAQNAIALKTHDHSKTITLTVANLADEIRRHNPKIAATRQLIKEAQGQLAQSGLKANPDMEFAFDTDRRFRELMLTAGYSQKFPRANRLLLEKKVSAPLVQAAAEEVREVERQILGQARKALVSVLAYHQEKELLAAQENNARELADFIKDAASRGELSPLDSASALLESKRYHNRARQIEVKLKLALAELKPLFNLNADGKIIAPGTLPPLIVASTSRPDLLAKRHRATSAAHEVSLEQARKYGDIEAGIFAGLGRKEDAPEGIENEHVVGFRVKIPLAVNDTNAGAVAAADARYRRLEMEAHTLQHRIRTELAAYYDEMEQWRALAQNIHRELLPISRKQIKETQAAYERGEISLQDVLRAQDQKLSLESTHLDALREFHLAKGKYDMAAAR